MKKSKPLIKFLFIQCFALLVVGLFVIYSNSKRSFIRNIELISSHSDMLDYQIVFYVFFSEHFYFPSNLNELYDFYSSDSERLKEVKKIMIDPFSKKGKDLLYIPVYSRKNLLCEGYLLVSAGIDRVLNTHLSDTVFFDDVENLNFYNCIDVAKMLSYRDYEASYSMRDFLFGNKDFFVEHADGVEIFLYNSKWDYSPTELFNKLYPKGFNTLECSVFGTVKSKDCNRIIVADSLYTVICNLYKGRLANVKENERIRVSGTYKNRIDPKNHTIYLDNCIIVK